MPPWHVITALDLLQTHIFRQGLFFWCENCSQHARIIYLSHGYSFLQDKCVTREIGCKNLRNPYGALKQSPYMSKQDSAMSFFDILTPSFSTAFYTTVKSALDSQLRLLKNGMDTTIYSAFSGFVMNLNVRLKGLTF